MPGWRPLQSKLNQIKSANPLLLAHTHLACNARNACVSVQQVHCCVSFQVQHGIVTAVGSRELVERLWCKIKSLPTLALIVCWWLAQERTQHTHTYTHPVYGHIKFTNTCLNRVLMVGMRKNIAHTHTQPHIATHRHTQPHTHTHTYTHTHTHTHRIRPYKK